MEKTLSMGAFTELDEREVMETEGGAWQFAVPAILFFAGVCAYGYNTVGNMNKITTAKNDLDQGETTVVSCKTVFGRTYDVTVTGGTKIGDYYSEASKLFID